MDNLPSRTRTPPSPSADNISPATLGHSEPDEPSTAHPATSRCCCVCGKRFTAKRPEARACSGRCRMAASRVRRVSALTDLIEATETQLKATEQGLEMARAALAGLRELVAAGASKVMP